MSQSPLPFFVIANKKDLTAGSLQDLKSASRLIFRIAVRYLIVQVIVYDHHGIYPRRSKLGNFYGSLDPQGIQWLQHLQNGRDELPGTLIIDSLANVLNRLPAIDEINLSLGFR